MNAATLRSVATVIYRPLQVVNDMAIIRWYKEMLSSTLNF